MAELIGGASAVLTIGGVDLSDKMTSASLDINYDDVETTSIGSAVRTRIAGLGDATLNITFNLDFAASEVDATLNGLVGTATAFVFKPTSASVSATNPSYAGSALVTSLTPLNAEVGALSTASVSWPVSGAITRATS
jgi:hypothetical protein|tara:strand:- start:3391 stop:3801 length:411 start_codon:yes stop_codon:yes gene_type:complete